MSFGYSVGDVITGANLTYKLIRIMAGTKGASDEYLEAMSELSAMQQAFLQVDQIRAHKVLPPATVNAFSFIVASSIDLIASFLEKSKGYQRRLENPKDSAFQSSWYKVGWTLYKSHELRQLRDALHTRLASIQMLLSASPYCTPLPSSLAQYRVEDQGARPSSTTTSTAIPSVEEESIDGERASVTEAEGNNRHRDQSIKTEGGPASQDPKRKNLNTNNDRHFIHFKDAVGRKFTFPWEYCRTWAGMEDLIKQAFMHVDVLGPHVHQGHYDLMVDGTIILPTLWEKVMEPDSDVVMTMWPIEQKRPPKAGLKPPSLPAWFSGGSRADRSKKERSRAGMPVAMEVPARPMGARWPDGKKKSSTRRRSTISSENDLDTDPDTATTSDWADDEPVTGEVNPFAATVEDCESVDEPEGKQLDHERVGE
ncbi:hypothetical protein VFPFJ_07496 [Purpureocillium lilacinum]|uniref:Ubiquitin-like domain-containing protein n=1 Tax=Purpureocillium lilacinum TaxID=33203 RepID=A0A179HHH5_PURLI|nr:hypothetical protein VFPFJ_07496 [Purpureocillium lilacinum]OAQ89031.1 hypothetical protein VFPFJ_07496 [Purpureocillium lilacinum]GJN84384.1 hypothetical protein PLIIFM63780_007940 [Purpureocillium lilacinum]